MKTQFLIWFLIGVIIFLLDFIKFDTENIKWLFAVVVGEFIIAFFSYQVKLAALSNPCKSVA
ncbi:MULTISPECIES: hypothetical protein [unclassified Pseudoalteromonas]|uniref:hypothetical protein n=1 Tax=unclassified Pseudoalteromonas TaxID=194690 RepID=UPI00110A4C14|nr:MULTISPECIES: hypothetical protein [unclassified Pseudoalteromonas]TMP48843.1 hypothetical protein CWB80_02120 [Pseudoalteromonas sp. S1650]TMP64226.1 hypothetical protein CWB79_21820 [Pseudoalteromonas sp. S1649]